MASCKLHQVNCMAMRNCGVFLRSHQKRLISILDRTTLTNISRSPLYIFPTNTQKYFATFILVTDGLKPNSSCANFAVIQAIMQILHHLRPDWHIFCTLIFLLRQTKKGNLNRKQYSARITHKSVHMYIYIFIIQFTVTPFKSFC